MFTLSFTNKFEKDLKRIKKRSIKDFELTRTFLVKELSINGAKGLSKKYFAHKLSGDFKDNWECHIKPDLLIIWIEISKENEITLVRIGSHSDLFK
ncbi:MAG: type II toxin-antitoxin system YafQ family toxin [Pelobium sp.]